MAKYDEAVRLLASPKTWCRGASQLTGLKDTRALVPLMHAFESPMEAEKLCLAEAMEALGGEAEARKLIGSTDAGERRVAMHLMILFSSDEQLPYLRDAALGDPDPELRKRAFDALRQQRQTGKWEGIVADLLGQPDATVRGWAIDRLAAHGGDSARARLSTYLPHETVPELRARIAAALRAPKP
jgi:HEAT repeat protein